MRYFVFIGSFLLCLLSCKSTSQNFTLEDYEGDRIYFGSGGGFSGKETAHILLLNGQLFKKGPMSDNFVAYNNIDKNLALQMYDNFEILGLDKREMSDPGNMYYFITRYKNGEKYKIVWGGLKDPPSQILKDYHKTLRALFKEIKASSK